MSTECLVTNGASTFESRSPQRQIPNFLLVCKEIEQFLLGFEVLLACQLLLGTPYPQHLCMGKLFWSQISGGVFLSTLESSNGSHNISGHPQQSCHYLQLSKLFIEPWELVVTRLCDCTAVAFSSTAHSSGIQVGSESLEGTSTSSQSGPRFQSWFTTSCRVLRPREGRSTGFDTPGQWLH